MDDNAIGSRTVDTFERNCGKHPGYRRSQARGVFMDGIFTPSGAAAELTTAAHLDFIAHTPESFFEAAEALRADTAARVHRKVSAYRRRHERAATAKLREFPGDTTIRCTARIGSERFATSYYGILCMAGASAPAFYLRQH